MAKQTLNQGRRWYVLHTYSGYEENVSQNLKQRIDSMDMEDKIFNILIPTEKKIKIKNGKRKIVEEKRPEAPEKERSQVAKVVAVVKGQAKVW